MSAFSSTPTVLVWLRRDLRLHDNTALHHALIFAGQNGFRVQPVFVFDRAILDELQDSDDARVTFIYHALEQMQQSLVAHGATLDVYYGNVADAHAHWQQRYAVKAVFVNRDYEAYGVERDANIATWWNNNGVSWHAYKDQCIFEQNEVLSNSGTPYTVFTPYSRKWKDRWADAKPVVNDSTALMGNLLQQEPLAYPSLASMGFEQSTLPMPEPTVSEGLLDHYEEKRNFPSLPATSRLGVHLRFGTISIRELALKAVQHSETFLNELIWRDFYMNILHHFPHVGKGMAFKPAYDQIQWRNNEVEFQAWCEGKTGYPLVDAGMRELNATGFMHNRVRMVVASFLCKHLLIDWRWGEAYFARKLLDFDLAANNGGWQWAAGSGCDAAPYFRVFNPALQQQKFDKDLRYIRRWVPEFNDPFRYPKPIVQHELARKRCLDTYAVALKGEPAE